MSVVYCRKLWSEDDDEESDDGRTDITRQWLIKVDNKLDTAATIRAANVLPVLYDPLPENGFWTVRRRSIKRTESPLHFIATLTYANGNSSGSTNAADENKAQQINPMDRRAVIRWVTVQYTKPFDRDINGKGVVNSAGDPFDPPAEVERSRWRIQITKNLDAVPTILLTYLESVNADSFVVQGVTINAGAARLAGIEIGELQKENGYEFYPFRFELELAPEWTKKLLDAGFHEKIGGTQQKIKIKDPDNPNKMVAPTSPQQLDGSGAKVANPTPDTAVYLTFQYLTPRVFGGVFPFE